MGDWVARNVRPWTGDQEVLWKNIAREAKPKLQNLKDGHLSRGYVNPRLVGQLHDWGVEVFLNAA